MSSLDVLAKVISAGFHGLRAELLAQREANEELRTELKQRDQRYYLELEALKHRVEDLEKVAAQ